MKKAILFLLAIVAASVFGAQKPPIIYSIYTTGTVAQVDAHVASAASIPAGVITNNQPQAVKLTGQFVGNVTYATNSGSAVSVSDGVSNAWATADLLVGAAATNHVTGVSNALAGQITAGVSGVASVNGSAGAVSIVGVGYVTVGTTSGVVTVTGTGGGGTTTTNASDLTTGTLALERLPSAVVTNFQSDVHLADSLYLSQSDLMLNGAGSSLAVMNGNTELPAPVTADSFLAFGDSGFIGAGNLLTNLNGESIQAGTINSNALDAATSAQLALVGAGGGSATATNLAEFLRGTNFTMVSGTNTFGASYTMSQGANLFIKNSTHAGTDANGLYTFKSGTTNEGTTVQEWTNAAGCVIHVVDDGEDMFDTISNATGTVLFDGNAIEGGDPTFPAGKALYTDSVLNGNLNWTTNYTGYGFTYNGEDPFGPGPTLVFAGGLTYTTNGNVWTVVVSNLLNASIADDTINSNKFDAGTAAQLALAGTGSGTELTVGTNVFGIVSNYVAGVYSQTTSLIIQGSTNTTANGVYSQAYSNYVEGVITALWTNGIANGISFFNDGLDGIINITNASGVPLFKPDLYILLPTFPFGQALLTADGLYNDGEFAWTSNTVAEPYWELQGWKADTNLYAGDIHGNTFYGDLSGATNYQFTSVGGVQTSNLLSTVNINETIRHGFSSPLMGFVTWALWGSHETNAVATARYLYTNGLTDVGYNVVCISADWGTRGKSNELILKTNLYPSGLASLQNAMATNDCKFGFYTTCWSPYGTPYVTEATAYADGYTLGSWGSAWVILDGPQVPNIPEAMAKHTVELFAAGLDQGTLDHGYPTCFFHVNMNTNRPWVAQVANGVYNTDGIGDGSDTSIHSNFRLIYSFLTNGLGFRSHGLWQSLLNGGDGSRASYWDTNCARVFIGTKCLEPFTLMFGEAKLGGSRASHISIYTNREAIRINQDVAVGGAQWLSTNCVPITNAVSQKARWRRMSNGDIAVGLWNWNTNEPSLFTLNLAKVPFLQTNVAYVLNVFDNAGQLVTNSIDQLVNTNGYNLLRISKAGIDGSGLINLNASALSSGTVPVERLPGGLLTNAYTDAIVQTNTGRANTALILTGNTNGAGFVIEYKTNNVSKFSVNTAGSLVSGGGATFNNSVSSSFGALYLGAQNQAYAIPNVQNANVWYFGNSGVSFNNTNGLVTVTNAVNATNGFSSGTTNYTKMPTNAPADGQVMTATGTNGQSAWAWGSLVNSTTFGSVPTLVPGDNFYCSSNGVPHVIWSDEAGTLHTNRLVP